MKKMFRLTRGCEKNVHLRKIWMTMKLTMFLFFVAIAQMMASGVYSQTTKITLQLSDATVKVVLNRIEENSEFYFLYNSKLVDVNRKVSVDAKEEKIDEILNNLFRETDVVYTVVNRQIVLTNKADQTGFIQQSGQVSSKTVTGTVKDVNGTPIPGASVVVKGTTTGVITDNNGKFSMTLPADATLIQFSFVGMKTQEFAISSKSEYNVVLTEEIIGLDEVVAIGYGTVKRKDLTGSIAILSASELVKRPSTNIANLLQGKVPGLQVIQGSGTPGEDASMKIRGIGTFNSAGVPPLTLVDGVERRLSDINPNDVESISVLIDASSADIYGSRGASGVILITTKKGVKGGKCTVEYDINHQIAQPTHLIPLVTNSVDYMTDWNTARTRAKQNPYFSNEFIASYRNATNDPMHPNTDWVHLIIKPAHITNTYIVASGGTDALSFKISGSYKDEGGIASLYNMKQFNVAANIDAHIGKYVTVGTNFDVIRRDVGAPNSPAYWDYFGTVFGASPLYGWSFSDPKYSNLFPLFYGPPVGENTTPSPRNYFENGFKKDVYTNFSPQVYLKATFLKDFTFFAKGAFIYNTVLDRTVQTPIVDKAVSWTDPTAHWSSADAFSNPGISNQTDISNYYTFYSTLSYNKSINETHNLNFLVGYEQEIYDHRFLTGKRVSFPVWNLPELAVGSATNQTLNGDMDNWAIMGYFGRFSYNYKSKYYADINFRYDGTSRLSPNTRWGFFPSLSLGYKLSEEKFMKSMSWINDLKIRASWGQVGNQNIGSYPYQPTYTTASYSPSTFNMGVVQNALTDVNLKWETSTMQNIGLDFTLWKGLLSGTIDGYDKVTTDILYQVPIPASVGLSAPTVNFCSLQNSGIELQLTHSNTIGQVRYSVSGNLSRNRNEVLKVPTPVFGSTTIQKGVPFNSWYLYEWIGIFQTQAEIDGSPKQPSTPQPGDLKFKDQNKDGVIDSKDRKIFSGAYPDIIYGFSGNISWKNFELNAFFQGVKGVKEQVGQWGVDPFMAGGPPNKLLHDHQWTGPGSTNSYPAMYTSAYSPVTGYASSYFLENGSYLRLKNLMISYNIPFSKEIKKHINGATIYFSGDNLLTFTKYRYNDPERYDDGGGPNSGRALPQLRTYTLGFKLKF